MLLMFWSNFSLYPLWICECMNVHKLKYDRVPTWKKREYFYKSRSSHVYYFMRKSRFMNDISGCINSLLFLERQNNFCAKRVECNSYCSKIRMVKLELFKFMKIPERIDYLIQYKLQQYHGFLKCDLEHQKLILIFNEL